jgi:hypothetical protein
VFLAVGAAVVGYLIRILTERFKSKKFYDYYTFMYIKHNLKSLIFYLQSINLKQDRDKTAIEITQRVRQFLDDVDIKLLIDKRGAKLFLKLEEVLEETLTILHETAGSGTAETSLYQHIKELKMHYIIFCKYMFKRTFPYSEMMEDKTGQSQPPDED